MPKNKIVENHKCAESSAIIAGASLAGLMAGLALAEAGFSVTIVERAGSNPRSGAALQVDSGESDLTATSVFLRKIASNGIRSIEAWSSVQSRLHDAAFAHPNITLHYNTKIVSAGQDKDSAWVFTENDHIFKGDIVVGADGHRSTVRKYVAAEKPDAQFAGYMIWVSILDEKDIPEQYWPAPNATISMPDGIGDFLLGSVVAGSDGSRAVGKRRLSWAWYDNSQNKLLRKLGCVDSNNITQHSLTPAQIPLNSLKDLSEKAILRWPQPWLSAALQSIKAGNITGIPVSEYIPYRLVNQRIALIGDAAHVMAPITAMGFNASLQDASNLADFAKKGIEKNEIVKALLEFESSRLKIVQGLVRSGQSFSRSFAR